MFGTDVKGAARARGARYIMLELQEHRLRLPQNLLNQSFARAHAGELKSPEPPRRDIFIEDHRCP
jgi:hypothetical protein